MCSALQSSRPLQDFSSPGAHEGCKELPRNIRVLLLGQTHSLGAVCLFKENTAFSPHCTAFVTARNVSLPVFEMEPGYFCLCNARVTAGYVLCALTTEYIRPECGLQREVQYLWQMILMLCPLFKNMSSTINGLPSVTLGFFGAFYRLQLSSSVSQAAGCQHM